MSSTIADDPQETDRRDCEEQRQPVLARAPDDHLALGQQ